MSADVDQLQRKWKELVAGNRMRCSFPAFNWNKDGVQFEAWNPLSSSSGAHFFQAHLSEKTKTDQAHEVGDRAVNHQRQIRTSTTLRNNTYFIYTEIFASNFAVWKSVSDFTSTNQRSETSFSCSHLEYLICNCVHIVTPFRLSWPYFSDPSQLNWQTTNNIVM